MVEFIAHLFGDFVLQNDWMAVNKGQHTKNGYLACLVHCIVYTLPFVCITYNPISLLLIFSTHFIIDKYRIASWWTNVFKIGRRLDSTNWLHIYLIFMVDMAMHLFLNHKILQLP